MGAVRGRTWLAVGCRLDAIIADVDPGSRRRCTDGQRLDERHGCAPCGTWAQRAALRVSIHGATAHRRRQTSTESGAETAGMLALGVCGGATPCHWETGRW